MKLTIVYSPTASLRAYTAITWNPPKPDTADTLNIIDIGVDIDLGDFG